MQVLAKYVALQVPGWALAGLFLWLLHDWEVLAAWQSAGLWALWVVKDFAIYPWLRHAYGDKPSSLIGVELLVGAAGIAADPIDPVGYVRVRGELWRAEGADGAAFAPGDPVRVREVRGLTLVVEAASDEPQQTPDT